MSRRETGGAAFPGNEVDSISCQILDQREGMSLRDYFAAKVLTAHAMYAENGYSMRKAEHRQMLAEDCYAMADAMLAERDK